MQLFTTKKNFMNLEKTNLILKKINRLSELINTLGEASSTEIDLLKAYIVDLYEAVAMSDIAEIEDRDIKEMKKKVKKLKKEESKLKKLVLKKHVAVEVEEEEVKEEAKPEAQEKKSANKPAVVKEEVKPTEAPKQAQFSPELMDLFNIKSQSELSDKLANAPIKDLTKSMGINEKIFTVNELFGGKQDVMNKLLENLNQLDSFDAAKEMMMSEVADKFDWLETERQKKAKNFIKLVRRRYSQ
jgi:hypothetical protein